MHAPAEQKNYEHEKQAQRSVWCHRIINIDWQGYEDGCVYRIESTEPEHGLTNATLNTTCIYIYIYIYTLIIIIIVVIMINIHIYIYI